MAFAAVVLAGGATSCDPMDKDDDQKEQTGGNTNTPSGDNEGSTNTPATLSIDGKQWKYDFNYGGMMQTIAVLDLGVTQEGLAAVYVDQSMGEGTFYYPNYGGSYTVTPTDDTSGTISITDPMDPSGEAVVFTYSNLTETSVTLNCTAPSCAVENVVAEKVEMSFDEEEPEMPEE